MMPKRFSGGDLLFHPVHGLCRVERVNEQDRSGKKDPSYSLVPKVMSKMKVRFELSGSDMEASGFHKVMSPKEANRILHYLRAGDGTAVQTDPTWTLARNILTFSVDRLKTRDQRKRQLLEHSIRGLVGEFACVFKTTLKATAGRIGKSMAKVSKTDPLVLAALGRAAED